MKVLNNDNYEVFADGTVVGPRGKILKPDFNRTGYKRVTLSQFGVPKRVFVHRLVATHFVDNPNNLNIVNHLDGDKTNNHYKNLEWTTHKLNLKHALVMGLRDMNNVVRMTPEEKNLVESLYQQGWTYQKIADEVGVTYNAVALSVRKV